MKRILINSSYNDELRVAFVEGAKLFDLDTELVEKTFYKGSVFKARISRVEMSLNAAFVDFGFDKHEAFFHSEIYHPNFLLLTTMVKRNVI